MTSELVPIGALFQRVEERGRSDLPLLSVYRDHGVVPREGRDDNYNRPGEDLDSYKVVRPGDLVLNKMKTWQGSLGVSDHLGIVSPAYFVARSRREFDRRFLHHLLRSRPMIAEYAARSKGIRPSQWDLPWDEFKAIKVALPSLAEQRAIADYLDSETARVDALIGKKQQIIRLLEERRELAFDKALLRFGVQLPSDLDSGVMRSLQLPAGWRVAKLSSALRQLTNGYVGPTRDILVDEGVRYIQGLHVKRGTIDFERRPFFVTESWHRARPRTSLRSGDVVIVQTGDIGQCAVIPDDFGEANCHALLIARTNENVACGPYLAAYLQSRFGRHSLLRLATGALHPHLEFGIRDAPLLLPPKATQSAIVDCVRAERELLDAGRSQVGRQIGLLAEHRQALVTAAVTGQFAVPEPGHRHG